jgi:hypothetical protein
MPLPRPPGPAPRRLRAHCAPRPVRLRASSAARLAPTIPRPGDALHARLPRRDAAQAAERFREHYVAHRVDLDMQRALGRERLRVHVHALRTPEERQRPPNPPVAGSPHLHATRV